ncbi:hypothetical protein CR513_59558, partial [Mucuna pruriens]
MSGTSRNPLSSVEVVPPYRAQERYDWVSEEVRKRGPKLFASVVKSLAKDSGWCTAAHRHCFRMEQCTPYERDDFVYMYEPVLTDLGVTLPFDSFASGVLRILGLAPTQLHPNGWAAIQAFRVACRALCIIPSAPLFLCFYSSRLTKEVGWVSLTPITTTPKGDLFAPYTDSYKGFKNQFLKIVSIGGAPFSTDTEPFPLYWKFPVRFVGFTASDLTPSECTDLRYLEGLPRNMHCKCIVPLVFERGSSALFADVVKSQNAKIHSYLHGVRAKKKESAADSSSTLVAKDAGGCPAKETQKSKSSSTLASNAPFRRVVLPDKGKRKAVPTNAERASKKGKASAGADLPYAVPLPSETPSAGPLWAGEPNPWELLPPETIQKFNQNFPAPHDVQKTFDTLGLYHLRSMAALSYWRQALLEVDPEAMKKLKEVAALQAELQKEKDAAALAQSSLKESRKLEADRALLAEEHLRIVEAQMGDLQKALSGAEEEKEKLVKQVSELEDTALEAYQGGFDNALGQVEWFRLPGPGAIR